MQPGVNKVSPSLIALIATLKTHQKRDFKKYVNFWGERQPRYVDLFNIVNEIVKNGYRDAEEITVLVRRKKLLQGMDLGWHSRFLYNKILESMRHFSQCSPLERELIGLLHDINFLYHKELYQDCRDRIREAKAIALKIDKQTYFLEACSYEKKVMIELGAKARYIAWVEVQQEENQQVEVLKRKAALYNTYIYFNRGENPALPAISPTLSLAEIQQLSDRPECTFGEQLLIARTLRDHLAFETRVKGIVNTSNEESAQRYEIYGRQQELLGVFHLQPWMKTEDPVHYRNNIDRLLSLGASLHDFSLFAQYLQDPIFNEVEKGVYYYKTVTYLYLIEKLAKGEIAAACAYIDKENLAKNLPPYKDKMPDLRYMAIMANCVNAYFINEYFAEALHWIGEIKTFEGKKEHLPALLMSRLMEIVAKIETGFYAKNDQDCQDISRLYRFSLDQGLLDADLRAWLKILELATDYNQRDLSTFLKPYWMKMSATRSVAFADSPTGPIYFWMQSRVLKLKMSEVLQLHLTRRSQPL